MHQAEQTLDGAVFPIGAVQYWVPDLHLEGTIWKATEAWPAAVITEGLTAAQHLAGDGIAPPPALAIDIDVLNLVTIAVGTAEQTLSHGGG